MFKKKREKFSKVKSPWSSNNTPEDLQKAQQALSKTKLDPFSKPTFYTHSPTRSDSPLSDYKKNNRPHPTNSRSPTPGKSKVQRNSVESDKSYYSSEGGAVKLIISERQQLKLLAKMQSEEKDNSNSTTVSTPPSKAAIIQSRSAEIDRVNKKNPKGETQLHQAAKKGDMRLVKRLIEGGAVVDVEDHAGWRPLHEAANRGHYDVVKFLVKRGAKINSHGPDDVTPLMDAVQNDHVKVVKFLVRHGADTSEAGSGGKKLDELAESDEMRRCLQKLKAERQAGGKKAFKERGRGLKGATSSTTPKEDSENESDGSGEAAESLKKRAIIHDSDTDSEKSSNQEKDKSSKKHRIKKKKDKHRRKHKHHHKKIRQSSWEKSSKEKSILKEKEKTKRASSKKSASTSSSNSSKDGVREEKIVKQSVNDGPPILTPEEPVKNLTPSGKVVTEKAKTPEIKPAKLSGDKEKAPAKKENNEVNVTSNKPDLKVEKQEKAIPTLKHEIKEDTSARDNLTKTVVPSAAEVAKVEKVEPLEVQLKKDQPSKAEQKKEEVDVALSAKEDVKLEKSQEKPRQDKVVETPKLEPQSSVIVEKPVSDSLSEQKQLLEPAANEKAPSIVPTIKRIPPSLQAKSKEEVNTEVKSDVAKVEQTIEAPVLTITKPLEKKISSPIKLEVVPPKTESSTKSVAVVTSAPTVQPVKEPVVTMPTSIITNPVQTIPPRMQTFSPTKTGFSPICATSTGARGPVPVEKVVMTGDGSKLMVALMMDRSVNRFPSEVVKPDEKKLASGIDKIEKSVAEGESILKPPPAIKKADHAEKVVQAKKPDIPSLLVDSKKPIETTKPEQEDKKKFVKELEQKKEDVKMVVAASVESKVIEPTPVVVDQKSVTEMKPLASTAPSVAKNAVPSFFSDAPSITKQEIIKPKQQVIKSPWMPKEETVKLPTEQEKVQPEKTQLPPASKIFNSLESVEKTKPCVSKEEVSKPPAGEDKVKSVPPLKTALPSNKLFKSEYAAKIKPVVVSTIASSGYNPSMSTTFAPVLPETMKSKQVPSFIPVPTIPSTTQPTAVAAATTKLTLVKPVSSIVSSSGDVSTSPTSSIKPISSAQETPAAPTVVVIKTLSKSETRVEEKSAAPQPAKESASKAPDAVFRKPASLTLLQAKSSETSESEEERDKSEAESDDQVESAAGELKSTKKRKKKDTISPPITRRRARMQVKHSSTTANLAGRRRGGLKTNILKGLKHKKHGYDGEENEEPPKNAKTPEKEAASPTASSTTQKRRGRAPMNKSATVSAIRSPGVGVSTRSVIHMHQPLKKRMLCDTSTYMEFRKKLRSSWMQQSQEKVKDNYPGNYEEFNISRPPFTEYDLVERFKEVQMPEHIKRDEYMSRLYMELQRERCKEFVQQERERLQLVRNYETQVVAIYNRDARRRACQPSPFCLSSILVEDAWNMPLNQTPFKVEQKDLLPKKTLALSLRWLKQRFEIQKNNLIKTHNHEAKALRNKQQWKWHEMLVERNVACPYDNLTSNLYMNDVAMLHVPDDDEFELTKILDEPASAKQGSLAPSE